MSQILPVGETFDEGSPVYGSILKAYIRAQHWTADAVTGYSTGLDYGDVHDAYRRAASIQGPINETAQGVKVGTGSGACACTVAQTTATAPANRVGCGFLWRPFTVADVEARISVDERVTGGSRQPDSFWMAGVSVRCSTGTVTSDATTNMRIVGGNGYHFVLVNNPAVDPDPQWFLLKTTAGVLSVLGQIAASGSAAVIFGQPFEVVLNAQNTGADVDLVASVRLQGFQPAGTIPLTSIISLTDVGGLQGQTRCGFILPAERAINAGVDKSVVTANYFHVEDLTAAATFLRDEFRRLDVQQLRTITDSDSEVGRDMASTWNGEAGGRPAFQNVLRRGASIFVPRAGWCAVDPSVVATGTTGDIDQGGFCQSQRRVTNTYHQRRTMAFEINSTQSTAPTNKNMVGIALRTSGGLPTTTPAKGYCAEFACGAGDGFVRIMRYNGAGNAQKIAEATGLTITFDAGHSVEFNCENLLDSGGDPTGIVSMFVNLDFAAVVFTALVSGVTGTTILNDSSTERTNAGPGEGFRIYAADGNQWAMVDLWAQPPLTGGGEDSQATISIGTEITNDSGQTLTLPVGWPINQIKRSDAVRNRTDGGHPINLARYSKRRRAWRVNINPTDLATRDAFATFVNDHLGAELAFTWTPPGPHGAAIKAHLLDGAGLAEALRAPGVYGYSFVIQELFDTNPAT